MKLAFRASACAELNLHLASELAAQIGLDGVEIRAPDAAAVDASAAVLSIVAGDDLNQLPEQIELAAKLKCRNVQVRASRLFDRSGVMLPKIADALLYAGHAAAANNVAILIDNEKTFGAMHRLWRLLDRVNHPSIGCNWNSLSAGQAGDDPTVAVPTLNSFIRSVQLQDAKLSNGVLTSCELGQGDLPLRKTMDRLRGIGFNGLVILSFAEQTCKNLADFKQSAARAVVVLQRWKIARIPVG